MVGMGSRAEWAKGGRFVSTYICLKTTQTRKVVKRTDLSHEGSQAVNEQVRLGVVHRCSLFQVCTWGTFTSKDKFLQKVEKNKQRITYLHRKRQEPDS